GPDRSDTGSGPLRRHPHGRSRWRWPGRSRLLVRGEKASGPVDSNEQRMTTPRAAGVAGIIFAVLLAAAIVLVRLALPEGAEKADAGAFDDPSSRDAVHAALGLVPFAGIFFLWFIGALRARVGDAEDRFIATAFLGSGLVFVATLFAAAAAADSALATGAATTGTIPPHVGFGRDFAYTLMTTYAMRMAAVFIFTTSAMGRRLGVLPRPLTILGYLCGLTLLLAAPGIPWSELVFPFWALIISVHILRAGLRSRPAPVGVP
ncbi:hypothetical protein ACWGI8_24005, partial [Streptomyces sp. NPDC054841]